MPKEKSMRKSLLLTALIWLSACSPQQEPLCGVYQGILPAADGPGIETTLTFRDDNSVTQRLVYIGQKDGIFIDKGTFAADDGVVAIMLPGDAPVYYRQETGRLRRLDMDMQPIEGALADSYLLKKVKSCPAEKNKID